MATDNQSQSYQAMRVQARRFLSGHKDGRYGVDTLRRLSAPREMTAVLEDDHFTDWEEMIKDHRGSTVIATNNRAARAAFELARQSSSVMGSPGTGKGKWVHFMATPLWYVLRRQIETVDPDYWNDHVNQMREALNNPEWCVVPPDVIRGELARHLPRGQSVPLQIAV